MNGSFSVLGKIGWLALICSQALSLTACDSPSDLSGTLDLSGPSHVMELRAPESLLPRNIDPNALQPRATLNGEDFGFRPLPNSDIWRGEATVPQGTTVTLSIEWIERFDNRDLTLAIFERTFENVSAQIALNLIDRDYVIDDIDRWRCQPSRAARRFRSHR